MGLLVQQEIKRMMDALDTEIASIKKTIAECPEGKLKEYKNKGKYTYLLLDGTIEKQGEIKRHRTQVDPYTVLGKRLIKKEILQDELATAMANRKALASFYPHVTDFSLYGSISEMADRYELLDADTILNAYSYVTGSDWATTPYEQYAKYEEYKRHLTSKGLKVRSKSELLIAEKLYDYNIPFHYEELVHIGEVNLAPDFTIQKYDGTLMYWEHQGLIKSEHYARQQINKLQLYASADIVPWKNLIITYDDPNGNIDLRTVEHEIKTKLLCP